MTLKFEIIFIIFLFTLHFTLQLPAQHWVEVDSSIGSVVDIIESEETLYSISSTGIFAYSADNGDTWTKKDIYDISTLTSPIFTSIIFFDANNGMIGIRDLFLGNQLIHTLDGGENWEVMATNYDEDCSANFIPIDFHLINDSSSILGLHLSRTYYITRDRGLNWSCQSPFPAPDGIQVKFIRSETEWLFNSTDGLYKTTDAGENWNLIFDKNFAHYQVGENDEIYGITWPFNEPDRIPVLYRGTNDFQSYDTISLKQFKGDYIDLLVAISDENLYILLNGSNVYYSNDGGQNFQLIQVLNNIPFRVSKLNGTWYMFGRGLWKLDESLVNTKDILNPEKDLVFPNPTSQFIHFNNYDYESFELIDRSGKTVQSGLIENQHIDISSQESGLYFLKVKKENNFIFKNIVKL